MGEEVMVSFESDQPEKPFVLGALYNGKEKSGYYDSNNELKVLHTNKGHIIEFDEREQSMGITIKDKEGNVVHLDTKDKNITVTTPETLTFNAKNLKINIEEDIETKVGRDIKTTARNNITQDSGKKTLIYSNDNTEIYSQKELDLYGKNKLITYTKGNAEMGALGQAHFHGTNALLTGKSKLDYSAPQMGQEEKPGEFKYGKEKEIIEAIWMDEKAEKEIKGARRNVKVSLWVQTRNYEEGENISITVKEREGKDIQEGVKEIPLTGTVQADGTAILKEGVEMGDYHDPLKEKTEEKLQQEEEEKQEQEEYKKWEEEQWQKHQNKNNKGFLRF